MKNLLSFTLGFMLLTSACGPVNETQNSEVLGTSVSPVGKSKSPKANGKTLSGFHFYLVKTKDKDLYQNLPAIMQSLQPGKNDADLKTLVPGRYKVKLGKDEVLLTGWYHPASLGSPYHDFGQTAFIVENGQLKYATAYQLANVFSQSPFFDALNPHSIMEDGNLSKSIVTRDYKVSLSQKEVIVDFPRYVDGREF